MPARLAHNHNLGLRVRAFQARYGYVFALFLSPQSGCEELLANRRPALPCERGMLDVDVPRTAAHILHDGPQAVGVTMILVPETRHHSERRRHRDLVQVIPRGNEFMHPYVAA